MHACYNLNRLTIPITDISGNPLYLTPTEMNKFDQQRAKLTRL